MRTNQRIAEDALSYIRRHCDACTAKCYASCGVARATVKLQQLKERAEAATKPPEGRPYTADRLVRHRGPGADPDSQDYVLTGNGCCWITYGGLSICISRKGRMVRSRPCTTARKPTKSENA
jgi:hypothetical protein